MNGAIARAEELLTNPRRRQPEPVRQPGTTRKSTARPLPRRSGTIPQARWMRWFRGIGTGGTLTGVAQVLKPRNPALKMIAVEPEGSPVLSGGKPGPHPLQGIGAGFVPKMLDTHLIDEIIQVSNEESFANSRRLARTEGIPGGISSGSALAAGVTVAKRPDMAGKRIVAIIPSFAERYISTALFDGL